MEQEQLVALLTARFTYADFLRLDRQHKLIHINNVAREIAESYRKDDHAA